MPASTRTRPDSRSTSSTRFIRSSDIRVSLVSTASLNEWPAPATRTMCLASAARPSASTTSATDPGRSKTAGEQAWSPAQLRHALTRARVSQGRGQRRLRGYSARQPDAHLLVHRGVVEQLEVVQAGQVVPVAHLERDPPRLVVARGAGLPHQEVAEQPPERPLLGPDRGRDHVVVGARQQRHVGAAVVEQGVGLAVAPVVLHQRAEAQVLDPRAAHLEEAGDRAGLAELAERPAGGVHGLLGGCPHVGGAEAEHVSHAAPPTDRRGRSPGGRRCGRSARPSSARSARSP